MKKQTHLSIPSLLIPCSTPFLLKQSQLRLSSLSIATIASNACSQPPPLRRCCISKRAPATAKITLLPSCRPRRQAGRHCCAATATTSAAMLPILHYHCLQNNNNLILLTNLFFHHNGNGSTQQQWQKSIDLH